MHSCSKVWEWIFALLGMICGCWTNAGQQTLSDYRIPRQMKRKGCFSAWGKHISLFYGGHEKRNSFGVWTLTTEYHAGSEITLELNLILCRLTREALPVSETLGLFRSEWGTQWNTRVTEQYLIHLLSPQRSLCVTWLLTEGFDSLSGETS